MPSFVLSFFTPDSSMMSISFGFLFESILNTPRATVLSPTLIIHVFFSSTSVLPLFTNETVDHVPRSLSRSPLEGSSLLGPSATISAPVVRIRKHTAFMRYPFSETDSSPPNAKVHLPPPLRGRRTRNQHGRRRSGATPGS